MENRNVKTVDEHGIDRDAHVICGFIIDQKKYVLYSIGRDDESDNIFVSGLVDNNDKTSNMVNIDDNMERTKINETARDLVTYSLRDEGDKSKEEIELPGGNKVKIVDVSFNREQNIDVTKTYIATVKKSVSKVSEDFYKIESVSTPSIEPIVNVQEVPVPEPATSQENIEDALKMAMPDLDLNQPLVVDTEPEKVDNTLSNQSIIDTIPLEKEPVVEPVTLTQPEPLPEPEKVEEPALSPVTPIAVPPVEEPKPAAVSIEPVVDVQPQKDESKVEPISVIQPEPISPPVQLTETAPQLMNSGEQVVNPLPSIAPVIPTPVTGVADETKLFFDGSSESNLNKALGEENGEKVVAAPQEGVQSLREFGVDAPSVVPEQDLVQENVKTLTKSRGFANNKFFMAIAIIFFVLSCVFLGYEAFQYFKLN